MRGALKTSCQLSCLTCRFEAPTRAEAAATVMQLVRAHPRHDIVIGVDSLGKGKHGQ